MALGIMSSVPKVRDHLAKTKDGFIEDCTNLLADEDQIVAEFAVNMLANISQGIFLRFYFFSSWSFNFERTYYFFDTFKKVLSLPAERGYRRLRRSWFPRKTFDLK